MRSLNANLEEFRARGVEVVAVSVDPPDVTRDLTRKAGYRFLFLTDESHKVIREWDLVHAGGGQNGDIARPAEFLVDDRGMVRWVNLTEDYRVRARPEDILKLLDEMGCTRRAGSGAP